MYIREREINIRDIENTLTHIKIPNSNDALLSECEVETFRSGGKGGQHANKTESAVRLTHTKSGIKVTCQDERSQYLNKIKCLKELRVRIEKYNFKPIKRIRTKPTRASKEKRLLSKKYNAEKKKNRKKPTLNNY